MLRVEVHIIEEWQGGSSCGIVTPSEVWTASMIAIIDYGMGDARSVSKAFEAVGHEAVVTRDPRVIGNASHVVLPGVGAFGDCMANVERYGFAEPIRAAIQSGKPFLGICLGLQLLFEESEEFGTHKGLGIIPGKVRRFAADPGLKVPHMGWNNVIERPCPLFEGIFPTGRTGILCIRFMSTPLTRPLRQPRRTIGQPSSQVSGGTMWWLVSSILKESGRWVATRQELWSVASS